MQSRTYTTFAGGVITFGGPEANPVIADMGQTEAMAIAQDSSNWDMREDGLCGEPGYALVSTTTGAPVVTGEVDFNGVHVKCAGTKVFTVAGTTETEIYPLGGTAQTAGAFYQFLEYDNGSGTRVLLLMNGVDKPLVYDGSTCARITFTDPTTIWNDARPQGAAVWRGSVMFWGEPTKKFRVYKPRPGTYNNFDNTNGTVDSFDVDAGFGGAITGIKPFTNNFLVIYKERCIRRLSGSSPFNSASDPYQIFTLTDAFGCLAPRTIVGNDLEHYFLARDGMRRLLPIQAYGDVDPKQPTYSIQDAINALNWSAITTACAVYDEGDKKIWLSVPTGASSTNNKIYIYRVTTQAISPRGDDDIKAASIAYIKRTIYHGDYTGSTFVHGSVNDYNGAAITRTWQSKEIAHFGIGVRKIYRSLHLYAETDGAGDVIVQWLITRAEDTKASPNAGNITTTVGDWDVGLWDTALWQTSSQRVFKIKNLGRGNAIALRFINTSASSIPKIRQVTLYFDTLNNSRG